MRTDMHVYSDTHAYCSVTGERGECVLRKAKALAQMLQLKEVNRHKLQYIAIWCLHSLVLAELSMTAHE